VKKLYPFRKNRDIFAKNIPTKNNKTYHFHRKIFSYKVFTSNLNWSCHCVVLHRHYSEISPPYLPRIVTLTPSAHIFITFPFSCLAIPSFVGGNFLQPKVVVAGRHRAEMTVGEYSSKQKRGSIKSRHPHHPWISFPWTQYRHTIMSLYIGVYTEFAWQSHWHFKGHTVAVSCKGLFSEQGDSDIYHSVEKLS
jgi:hypothetical protein